MTSSDREHQEVSNVSKVQTLATELVRRGGAACKQAPLFKSMSAGIPHHRYSFENYSTILEATRAVASYARASGDCSDCLGNLFRTVKHDTERLRDYLQEPVKYEYHSRQPFRDGFRPGNLASRYAYHGQDRVAI